jgi:hypothetical protein
LVVWKIFYDFPFSWECHHPNWRSPSFFRGVETTNQEFIEIFSWKNLRGGHQEKWIWEKWGVKPQELGLHQKMGRLPRETGNFLKKMCVYKGIRNDQMKWNWIWPRGCAIYQQQNCALTNPREGGGSICCTQGSGLFGFFGSSKLVVIIATSGRRFQWTSQRLELPFWMTNLNSIIS